MTDDVAAGSFFVVVFGCALVWGFATGRMPALYPGVMDRERLESPLGFWSLAVLNTFGLVVGIFILTKAMR